jgi:hypothetical protein
MNYERAIGFVLLNLSGAKVRVTTFSPDRVVDSSEFIVFSNSVSKLVHLDPGRWELGQLSLSAVRAASGTRASYMS